MSIGRTTALLLVACLGADAVAESNTATGRMIDQSVYPDAKCNDGSAPRYSYALASTPTKKWLIHLKGGASCTDELSCANRWFDVGVTAHAVLNDPEIGNHRNMVNAPAPDSFAGLGIVDFRTGFGTNPLQDMNRLYVHYCSSDVWRGRGGTLATAGTVFDPMWRYIEARPTLLAEYGYLEPPAEIVFSGADIVDAIVDIVKTGTWDSGGAGPADASRIPDDSTAEIVLTGSSAGSNGVTHNLDRVAAAFTDPALGGVDGVTVFGVMDSGDPAGALPDPAAELITTDAIAGFWGGGDPGNVATDASCAAAESTGGNPDHCQGTGYVLTDYIETPYFVAQNSYDQVVHGLGFKARRAAYIKRGLSKANAAARASTDLRTAVTRATASFGVRANNPPGLYIPNYFDGAFDANQNARGVHQLMADTARFWNSPASIKAGMTDPKLSASPATDRRSFASALRCFRAETSAPALVPQLCRPSRTTDDARVVNDAYR